MKRITKIVGATLSDKINLNELLNDVCGCFEAIGSTTIPSDKLQHLDMLCLKSEDHIIAVKEILSIATNPQRVMHVRISTTHLGETFGKYQATNRHVWYKFIEAVSMCERGVISGDTARRHVLDALALTHMRHSKMLLDAFNKDLRIGLAKGLINKQFPSLIPTFDCQLAATWKGEDMPSGSWVIEPKLDGMRCIIKVHDGTVQAFTRKGKAIFNIDHILDAIKIRPDINDVVLDGELMAGSWAETMSIARSQSHSTRADKLIFTAFDIIPWEEFERAEANDPYSHRRGHLVEVVTTIDSPFTVKIPSHAVEDARNMLSMHRSFVQNGFEGSVLKSVTAPYGFRRSANWLKVKDVFTGDFLVVDVLEGTGRLKGTMGSLVLDTSMELEETIVSRTRVGTGFSDDQRDAIWNAFQKGLVIGRTVEVSYQMRTPDNNLRFPVFVRFREDK